MPRCESNATAQDRRTAKLRRPQRKSRLSELRLRRRAAEAQKLAGHHIERAADGLAEEGFARLEEEVYQKEIEVEIEREVRDELGTDLPPEDKAFE